MHVRPPEADCRNADTHKFNQKLHLPVFSHQVHGTIKGHQHLEDDKCPVKKEALHHTWGMVTKLGWIIKIVEQSLLNSVMFQCLSIILRRLRLVGETGR